MTTRGPRPAPFFALAVVAMPRHSTLGTASRTRCPASRGSRCFTPGTTSPGRTSRQPPEQNSGLETPQPQYLQRCPVRRTLLFRAMNNRNGALSDRRMSQKAAHKMIGPPRPSGGICDEGRLPQPAWNRHYRLPDPWRYAGRGPAHGSTTVAAIR